jgi:hypothetical protein
MIRLTLYFACTNCDAQTLDPKDVRKRPFIGPLSKWILRAATTGVLVGVYQFNTNYIGMQHVGSPIFSNYTSYRTHHPYLDRMKQLLELELVSSNTLNVLVTEINPLFKTLPWHTIRSQIVNYTFVKHPTKLGNSIYITKFRKYVHEK